MKFAVVLSFIILVASARSEIYEPNMEDTPLPEDHQAVPAPLLISRPRSYSYGPAERVQIPDAGVPDVIMYLSTNSPPSQGYSTGSSVSMRQYVSESSVPSRQYVTYNTVPNHQYFRMY